MREIEAKQAVELRDASLPIVLIVILLGTHLKIPFRQTMKRAIVRNAR